LNAVGCLDACFVANETLENLPLPTKVGPGVSTFFM
jgi:hypothetical protein